jgi:hypothetical protein
VSLGSRCDGGHLASYLSFEEQYQVEQYFTDEGMLMPKFHKMYWMGLKTTEEDWPSFIRWAAARLLLRRIDNMPLCWRGA